MSPSFLTRSVSKRSLRSFSRATGTISRSANSRAVSRISRCSSVSSKSINGRRTLPPHLPRGVVSVVGPQESKEDVVSIRTTKPALDDEAELRRHVEYFPVAARELPSLDVAERIEVVERITSF